MSLCDQRHQREGLVFESICRIYHLSPFPSRGPWSQSLSSHCWIPEAASELVSLPLPWPIRGILFKL